MDRIHSWSFHLDLTQLCCLAHFQAKYLQVLLPVQGVICTE